MLPSDISTPTNCNANSVNPKTFTINRKIIVERNEIKH